MVILDNRLNSAIHESFFDLLVYSKRSFAYTEIVKIHHHFLPHPHTHQKSRFLSWQYLLIYILLVVLIQSLFHIVSLTAPGVLGTDSEITVAQIVDGTNKERQKLGLSELTLNESLSRAAHAKALNMFEENYWAHFSPSGKDPWGFISSAGYKFSFAGENLAKNFYTSNEVINAWMNSPSHKENIVNNNFQEIGVAVEDGILKGQKTTLIVQMFGKPVEALAERPQVNAGGKTLVLEGQPVVQTQPLPENIPSAVQGKSTENRSALINPNAVMRGVGIVFVIFIGGLLMLDLMVIRKRQVYRFTSHHFAHFTFLILVGTAMMVMVIGNVI